MKEDMSNTFWKQAGFFLVFLIIIWCFVSTISINKQKRKMEFIIANGINRFNEVNQENVLLKRNYLYQFLSIGIKLSDTIILKSIVNDDPRHHYHHDKGHDIYSSPEQ